MLDTGGYRPVIKAKNLADGEENTLLSIRAILAKEILLIQNRS